MYDQFAHLGSTGERHLIDIGVGRDGRSRGFTVPGHNIDYAGGKPNSQ